MPATPCPTPHKRRYSDERDAKVGLVKSQIAALFSASPRPMPARVYRCACKGWHLTSKGEWQVG